VKKFQINEEFITSITIHQDIVVKSDIKDEQGNVGIKKGTKGTGTRNEDHPEFTKLRNRLSEDGFIEKEDRWVNGDSVLKAFALNDVLIFKKGEQFSCASALEATLSRGKKKCRINFNHDEL